MEGNFINENLSLEWESGRFYGEKRMERPKEERGEDFIRFLGNKADN